MAQRGRAASGEVLLLPATHFINRSEAHQGVLSLSCHHERPLGREGSAVSCPSFQAQNNSRFLASLVMTISEER